jgi:oxygen-dependent protoporphyrinogen oxidase
MIEARKHRQASNKPLFMTPKGGVQAMVEALENALTATIITGKSVQSLEKTDSGVRLMLDDGSFIEGQAVVLATPAYISGDLLESTSQELADLLRSIRYVSTATVSLGFKNIEHPLNGFGLVIPRTEPTKLLACTWTSTKFDHRTPDEQHVLIRCFIGGARNGEMVETSDDDTLVQTVRDELRQIMGITAEPIVARVFRWIKANPQYDVGHLEKVDRIEALCPDGIYVTGSPYRGVGMPDCINQANQTAKQVIAYLKEGQHEY